MNKIAAHYISGTHWDREWYRPFQEFRFLLVKLIDGLLDLMEASDDFRYFQLDGQTCMLEDYLEVRPENRERLARLIRDGRILIGPWFTMPDLFCVGDEAIVRNLLLGRRISREWGVDPMPVGFVCDMFGHPSQMAQIFAGFRYGDCVLGRGTNESTTPPFFLWEAPDGSRVFTFKLQDAEGYGAFATPRTVMEQERLIEGTPLKGFCADMEIAGDDPVEKRRVREKHFRIELAKYMNHEIARSGDGHVLCLMDSMDHIQPAADVAAYLRLVRETCPGVEPKHSTLPEFFREARAAVKNAPVRFGELREPSRNRSSYLWLIPNCPSARVRMKAANDECQTLLEKWADPFVAMANQLGAGIPVRFLAIAWKYLLTNHAHDSICGCSIDQVHRDMLYRFDQSRILGEQLRNQAVGFLTSSCTDLARSRDEFTLTVVNPLPFSRDEVVIFDVDLPVDYPTEFRESFFSPALKSFTLEDGEGKPIPYQRLSYEPLTNERSRFAKFCFQSDGRFSRYRIAARLALPGLGFQSLRVLPSGAPVRTSGSLRTGPGAAANEFLAIEIAANGTLTLKDKTTGEVYQDLFTLEDRSEIADGWFHAHGLNDEQILSAACSAQASVVHDGPEVVALRSVVTLQVPARYDDSSQRPAPERVPLVISSIFTLRREARTVDVEVRVDTQAEDHRLRVLLPTDCSGATSYLAHQVFDFVDRAIAIDPGTSSWQEMEQVEKPFLGIQSIGEGSRGLALLSAAGPHEGGVADDLRRTMLVTLLRSFRSTVSTGGERDGLETGVTTFRFRLLPFGGELPRSAALAELAKLQSGLLTRQTGRRPSGYPEMQGNAPATQGFMDCLSGNLVVSAIKAPEGGDGLIVRLWNPTGKTTQEEIVFSREIIKATPVYLDEEPLDAPGVLAYEFNKLTVQAAPKKIVTLKVVFRV